MCEKKRVKQVICRRFDRTEKNLVGVMKTGVRKERMSGVRE